MTDREFQPPHRAAGTGASAQGLGQREGASPRDTAPGRPALGIGRYRLAPPGPAAAGTAPSPGHGGRHDQPHATAADTTSPGPAAADTTSPGPAAAGRTSPTSATDLWTQGHDGPGSSNHQRTDQPTDQVTNQQTDRVRYR
ncbi:MAG: hypothetical protein QOF30_3624 [Acidimicrobiaceae bacterium]|nr:hypothetical protein [Acidimicrobiaceae bacterium]